MVTLLSYEERLFRVFLARLGVDIISITCERASVNRPAGIDSTHASRPNYCQTKSWLPVLVTL